MSAADIPPRSARVLVVEDEAMLAVLVASVLSDGGHDVMGPAASVRRALELLALETPAAAVLDVRLDRETVFPVADLLAARGVPFVFVTGYGQVAASQHRHRPCLAKPYRAEMLLTVLRALLEGPAADAPGRVARRVRA